MCVWMVCFFLVFIVMHHFRQIKTGEKCSCEDCTEMDCSSTCSNYEYFKWFTIEMFPQNCTTGDLNKAEVDLFKKGIGKKGRLNKSAYSSNKSA
jgi:hypothetical protein